MDSKYCSRADCASSFAAGLRGRITPAAETAKLMIAVMAATTLADDSNLAMSQVGRKKEAKNSNTVANEMRSNTIKTGSMMRLKNSIMFHPIAINGYGQFWGFQKATI